MTDQIPNQLYFQDNAYTLVAVSNLYLFTPRMFGIETCMVNTACWRGYVAYFFLQGRRLVVKHLEFCTLDDEVPIINGVHAQDIHKVGWFDYRYINLDYELDYTGGLLIANDYIGCTGLFGVNPAIEHRTVYELLFHRGSLIAFHDRSEAVEKVRKEVKGLDRVEAIRSADKHFLRIYGFQGFGEWYWCTAMQFREKRATKESIALEKTMRAARADYNEWLAAVKERRKLGKCA